MAGYSIVVRGKQEEGNEGWSTTSPSIADRWINPVVSHIPTNHSVSVAEEAGQETKKKTQLRPTPSTYQPLTSSFIAMTAITAVEPPSRFAVAPPSLLLASLVPPLALLLLS